MYPTKGKQGSLQAPTSSTPYFESPKQNQSKNKISQLLKSVIKEARPKQWLKNILVFAAPGAAGVLIMPGKFLLALMAFFIFSMAASGTYFLNDLLDIKADQHHPTKSKRPIASGQIPLSLGWFIGSILLLGSIVASLFVGNFVFSSILVLYVAITVAYSFWLKHHAIIDLAAVSSGFILRAIAGGIITHVYLSDWFLIVVSFVALFIVTVKRSAEHLELGDQRHHHRKALGEYSLEYLRYIRSVSSAVVVAGYCLWAFEKSSVSGTGAVFFELSIIPFVMSLFRYALLADAGLGTSPEDIITKDLPLQILGLIWITIFGLGVYVH